MFEGNETQFLKLLNWDVSFSVVVTTLSHLLSEELQAELFLVLLIILPKKIKLMCHKK